MKRMIVCMAFALALALCVFAKSGDIAGEYYSTDILTTLNGEPIDAINIGGNTLISAEDMQYYSFGVIWDGNARTLAICRVSHANCGAPPAVQTSDLPSGTPLGNYYETDIVTTLDGEPIAAYNLGGRTYIHAEAMRALGYAVAWDGEARTLAVTSPDRAGYVYSLTLTAEQPQTEAASGGFTVGYTPAQITISGDAEYFSSALAFDGRQYRLQMGFSADTVNGYANVDALLSKLRGGKCPVVSINGTTVAVAAPEIVERSGRIGFSYALGGIPAIERDKINSVNVILDQNPLLPVTVTELLDKPSCEDIALGLLKRHENDYIDQVFDTEEYSVFLFYDSPRLGVVTDHLYLFRKADYALSGDLLETVRAIKGFHLSLLRPFDFHLEGGELVFSVVAPSFGGAFRAAFDPEATVTVKFITER